MPIAIWERFGSRATRSDDQGSTMETLWDIYGSNNELEVRFFLGQWTAAAMPFYFDSVNGVTLYRTSHNVEQIGDQLWEGTVTYTSPGHSPGGPGSPAAADSDGGFDPNGNPVGGPPPISPPEPCSYQFSFDTAASQSHITHSLGTVQREGPGAFVPPDYKQAIGVRQDSEGKLEVEGVDIYFPSLKWSEVHVFDATFVTPAYVKTLASLTATVNNAPFRNFAAGEALFLGAQGQSQKEGVVPITFSFEASQNVTNITVAGISGVNKGGWDYLWVAYEDKVDETVTPAKKYTEAFGVYVEQVYKHADWSGLALPC